jgi:hypothetical protein
MELAARKLIARNPIGYHLAVFRAFLHLSKEECENMSLAEYLDNTIILKEVLKILHAPYINHENE